MAQVRIRLDHTFSLTTGNKYHKAKQAQTVKELMEALGVDERQFIELAVNNLNWTVLSDKEVAQKQLDQYEKYR